MQNILPVGCLILGIAIGAGLAWLLLRARLREACAVLSADALRNNNQAFLELVKPVRESLEKVDTKMQELETARVGAYASLTQQVRSLLESQTQLRVETGKLVGALRTPSVRGNWGEMQLKR